MTDDVRTVAEEASACFSRFDLNGDGVIDRNELGQVLQELDANVWTDERVERLLSLVDVNGDGHIDYDEVTTWAFNPDQSPDFLQRASSSGTLQRVHSCVEHFRIAISALTADPKERAINVIFMNGSDMKVSVPSDDTVQSISEQVSKALALPKGRIVQLINEGCPVPGWTRLADVGESTFSAIIVTQELSEEAVALLKSCKGSIVPDSHWDLLEVPVNVRDHEVALAEIVAKAQPTRLLFSGGSNVDLLKLATAIEAYPPLKLGSVRFVCAKESVNDDSVARILRCCPDLHHCYFTECCFCKEDVQNLRSEFAFYIVI